MSGGPPRLRLPVTPQNIAIASAFAAACARTLDATETNVEAVRAVVAEVATTLLQQEGATMIIQVSEAPSGAHALEVTLEGESPLAAGAIIEPDRWVIPITESAR